VLVICPYTRLRPETSGALDVAARRGHELEYVDVSGSDTAYAELLADLWADGRGFILVEHDIVIRPGLLDELARCGHDYCAAPYALREYVAQALGCTKFASRLLAGFPDVMERVLRVPTNFGPPGHWRQLDTVLMRTVLLNRYGLQPHLHLPTVEHLNEAKQLREGAPTLLEVPTWPALTEPT
jgi:hypothetical protein